MRWQSLVEIYTVTSTDCAIKSTAPGYDCKRFIYTFGGLEKIEPFTFFADFTNHAPSCAEQMMALEAACLGGASQ